MKNPMVLSETNPVRGVNFDVIYQDEDLVTEGTHTSFIQVYILHHSTV